MSKSRDKQREAKRTRKAEYGISGHRTEEERKQLNPKVPYQRRKAARMRGEPMKARSTPPWWTGSTLTGLSPGKDMFAQEKTPWKEKMKSQAESSYEERRTNRGNQGKE